MPERVIHRRSGLRHVYTLQPGENFSFMDRGMILVTHPEKPPRMIDSDGTEVEMILGAFDGSNPETNNA